MAVRTCNFCGKMIDTRLVNCPECGQNPADEVDPIVKEVVRLAKKRFWSSVRLWGGVLFAVICGGTILGVREAWRSAKAELDGMLVARLSAEFEQPRIRETISKVAENQARDILETEINPPLEVFKETLAQSQADTRRLVKQFADDLTAMRALMALEDKARTGSCKAYEELRARAGEATELGTMAKGRILILDRELAAFQLPQPSYQGVTFDTSDKKGIQADSMSTRQLFDRLSDDSMPLLVRQNMMTLLSWRPQDEVLRESLRALKTTESLYARASVCGILNAFIHPNPEFMDIDAYIRECTRMIEKDTPPRKTP